MSHLVKYREQHNLTQEELAERSGLSVRTIQRIEAGMPPKGYTLKVLAKVLEIDAKELAKKSDAPKDTKAIDPETDQEHVRKETGGQAGSNVQLLKLINLSSLPFTFLPPLNIIVPLLIAFYKKEKEPEIKQIISIQILWTILATVIFMLGVFVRKWFDLNNGFVTVILLGLILCNAVIILINAAGIDRKRKLPVRLKFNLL